MKKFFYLLSLVFILLVSVEVLADPHAEPTTNCTFKSTINLTVPYIKKF